MPRVSFRSALAALAAVATLAAPAAASGASHGSPVLSLAQLIAGNERFAEGKVLHPRQNAARRSELTAGQKPGAIVLSCSDSRVPPEVVFDQGLGDVFVVRVAGNTLDAAAVASIEYAVEHLGASLVVVMGHHACGAVKTALTVEPANAGSADLESLVGAIRPRVQEFIPLDPADKTLDRPVRANVDAVCRELVARSAIVHEAVTKGEVVIVPSLYALASGRVEMWDAPAGGSAAPAAHAAPAKAAPHGAKAEPATAAHDEH